ncbi:hypothetical protein FQN54_006785 [Arachnomyces sp. PD_36]|nr:hypothetical protein FQN54_006785 [Arachnomyces sp. PD_36]
MSDISGYSANHLVTSPLPQLRRADKRTLYPSTQRLEYKATLGYWSNFEKEVREANLLQQWDPSPLAHAPRGGSRNPFYLTNELYACGDEYSVQGRFAQNVGQVMTSVFGTLGMDGVFADYRACGGGGPHEKVPDYAMIADDSSLLAIGEMKTPWVHEFSDDIKSEPRLRKALGQVARYMASDNLKFGFLTSYDKTIFLKFGGLDANGNLILWHSDLIKYDAKCVAVPPNSPSAHYRNKVTIRECFLFVGRQIVPTKKDHNRHKTEKHIVQSTYIRPSNKTHTIGKSEKSFQCISDNKNAVPPYRRQIPPVPGQSSPAGSQRQSPERDQRHHDSQGVRGSSRSAELAVRTTGGDSRSRSSSRFPSAPPPQPLVEEDGSVRVRYHDEEHCHYFIADTGEAIPVELERGRRDDYFMYLDQKRRAKLDKGKGKGNGKGK